MRRFKNLRFLADRDEGLSAALDRSVAIAREKGNDLIVMGTLGRAGIAGLFIGNTAEDVLRGTQTAVLIVKPDGFITPVE